MRFAVIFLLFFRLISTYGVDGDYLVKKDDAEARYSSFMQAYERLYFWDKVPLLWAKFRMQFIVSRMGKYQNKITELRLEGKNGEQRLELIKKIEDKYQDFMNIYKKTVTKN